MSCSLLGCFAAVLVVLPFGSVWTVAGGSSLPFVANQSKSRPQGWPLRRRETIGCQLRGIVAFLAPPPGISLRSVVAVAVIVASTPRDFVELASKKGRLRLQGKTRLAKYYLPLEDSEKHKVQYEVILVTGILHTIVFHRALGLVRPKNIDLELFEIICVQCRDVEVEKKIDEKIEQFISWVEKHRNKMSLVAIRQGL
ncbi:hypothetical protein Q3G72_023345 [Acer saccharum]|nr:hypothetical protein Q3G72_023345 [Acer saccharum]